MDLARIDSGDSSPMQDDHDADDRRVRAMAAHNRKNGKWIQGAITHPGALHKQLGVPMGEKIPEKTLDKAANSDNPLLAKRANLAKTLKKF